LIYVVNKNNFKDDDKKITMVYFKLKETFTKLVEKVNIKRMTFLLPSITDVLTKVERMIL